MGSAYENIDYKNNIFEYPELTRIIGEPTTASLITLLNEVKTNAQAVHTTLGGGAHGHLGLVCSSTTYATLVPSNTPYERPRNPERLQIEGTETQYQIAQRNQEYQEALRLFREVISVERAIIQQMVAAIEPKYLKALRNTVTNKITKTIPEIFEYLFDTYGDISPQELRMLTTQVETLTFPPNEPVDTIFTEIDDLATIAELARAPMSEPQKINMAYLLLQNTQVYSNALNKWNQLSISDHTWENFKRHFRTAQKGLRRTGALSIHESINHTEILSLIQQGVQLALEDKHLTSTDSSATLPTTESINSASSISSDLTLQTMQKQIDIMQQMLENMHTMHKTNNTPRKKKKNPNQNKYCWTHGLCSHDGTECRNPADGHVAEATVNNRMGGSSKNLPKP